MSAAGSALNPEGPRHSAVVRVTHWVTVVCFLALLVSGLELVVSHPRFYWGESGNVMMRPAFTIPIPSSRGTVPTGYKKIMPDENGWSRYLHFQAAWVVVLTGLVYGIAGVWSGHFRRDLVPVAGNRSWGAVRGVMRSSLRRGPPADGDSYNVVQRLVYGTVIFCLFPLMIWTGLAMSPSFTSAVPLTVTLLGGRQTARTLHFLVTDALVIFVVVHVAMVIHAGFKSRMRGMITGGRS